MRQTLFTLILLLFGLISFSQDGFDCYNYNDAECKKCLESKKEKLIANKVKTCKIYSYLNNKDTNLTTVYSYDTKGNLIKSQDYREGKLHSEDISKYDLSNNLLEISSKTFDKLTLENKDNCYYHNPNKTEYKYDKSGNQIEIIYSYPKSNKQLKKTFIYDKNGRCVEEHDNTVVPSTSKKYVYDATGLILSISTFNERGEEKIEFKYDSSKQIIQKTYNFPEGQIVVKKTLYKYDLTKKLIEQIDFNANNRYETIYNYHYSDTGLTKTITYYSFSGYQTEHIYTYKYDINKDIIESIDGAGFSKYEYNNIGLLIKKTEKDNVRTSVYEYKYELY